MATPVKRSVQGLNTVLCPDAFNSYTKSKRVTDLLTV